METLPKTKDICFHMHLAQIGFSVECTIPSTERLCQDYCTEYGEEKITILPSDLEQEKARLLKENPLDRASWGAVESLVLCRKLAEYFPERDRVLFHGSSLAVDGHGILFTAKSGTGKSTQTRLWREVFGERVVMVNDDKPFLHISGEQVTVYGSPWQGKHNLGSNTSAPVRAIVIVCRGERNCIEPVSPREALPLLMQQTFYPVRPDHVMQTLTLVERMTRIVPVYRLYCNMDPQAVEVAYAGIFTQNERNSII